MLFLEHLFAVCLLGHMLWAAIVLQKEYRRLRAREVAKPERRQPDAPEWAELAKAPIKTLNVEKV